MATASGSLGARDSRGYLKVNAIGRGSFGQAWLVKDQEDNTLVMKVVDMSGMNNQRREKAVNEVKVLSSLKHPYIIDCRESFAEKHNLCIVMDYAEGGDLSRRILQARQEKVSFPEDRILRWFTEATVALKYLHDRHVLHRDLKSQNLFLTKQDRLRVGDFGIAKVLEGTDGFAKTTVGTPYYFSPEMCMEKPYSYASDIWALGITLFEMACLRVPFETKNLPLLWKKITGAPLPSISGPYSEELKTLCKEILQRDEHERPTAKEILQRQFVQAEMRRMFVDAKIQDASAQQLVDTEPGLLARPRTGSGTLARPRTESGTSLKSNKQVTSLLHGPSAPTTKFPMVNNPMRQSGLLSSSQLLGSMPKSPSAPSIAFKQDNSSLLRPLGATPLKSVGVNLFLAPDTGLCARKTSANAAPASFTRALDPRRCLPSR